MDFKLRNEQKNRLIRIKNLYVSKKYDALIKEADIKASDPDLIPHTVVRWRAIIRDLKSSGAPISLKDLKIDGDDLGAIGLKGRVVGMVLERIFDKVLDEPSLNDKDILINMAISIKNELI